MKQRQTRFITTIRLFKPTGYANNVALSGYIPQAKEIDARSVFGVRIKSMSIISKICLYMDSLKMQEAYVNI